MKTYDEEYSDKDPAKDSYNQSGHIGWYEKWINKVKGGKTHEVKKREKIPATGLWGDRYADDDYSYQYDYDFSSKNKGGGTAMSEYERTGVWKGYEYYKASTIDYKYIEQMANALSAAHSITVKTGDWAIDIRKKELTYSPLSLMYGTKADVMAALLHEIGHLRYTTEGESVTDGPIAKKYSDAARQVLNLYEDFRIDEIMRHSYAGAEGIYESMQGTVKKIADGYKEKSEAIKLYEMNAMTDTKRAVDSVKATRTSEEIARDYELDPKIIKELAKLGGGELLKMFAEKAEADAKRLNLYDFLGGVMLDAYGLDATTVSPEVKELVDKVKAYTPEAIAAKSTQEVYDMLEIKVFPIIEDLLKAYKEGSEADKKMFGEQRASSIAETARILGSRYDSGTGKEVEARSEMPGHGASPDFPKQWLDGDYSALKESVDSGVKELARKLQNIKAKDLTVNYEKNLRKGKLNIKAVYRLPSGRVDIFKKKIEQVDRTQTFAFSLWVDVSGSMRGDRMMHATRGLILLAETLKKMGMPFEIITFENYTTTYKKYGDDYKGEVLNKIGRLANYRGGGNRADFALDASRLPHRPEKNKFVIALSDGVMDDMTRTKRKFQEWNKRGIHTIGIDISQEGAMDRLDIDKVFQVKDAGELPNAFVEAFKAIIKTIK